MSLRPALFLLAVTLGACITETWIYQPTDEMTVPVDADETELLGEAVLTYASEHLPAEESEVVSNALRMTVTADDGSTVTLEYPNAAAGASFSPDGSPGVRNLDGVFRPCGADTCTVVVPFRLVRAAGAATTLAIEADAIVSYATPVRGATERDEASLELSVL
ncbi:MAG: hypothetical protein KC656_18630 [Myxococcales bacterium]|nr:hypothetical protein [Myxococcales bacterium]